MSEAAFSYRPSPEAKRALESLMERWKCHRSDAIHRALTTAAGAERPKNVKDGTVKPAYRGFGKQVVDQEKLFEFQKKLGMAGGKPRRAE